MLVPCRNSLIDSVRPSDVMSPSDVMNRRTPMDPRCQGSITSAARGRFAAERTAATYTTPSAADRRPTVRLARKGRAA
jgi:hypothetical protein